MPGISLVFIELGAAVIGLSVVARLANRWGFSTIPLYLVAGLVFGKGGIVPLHFSNEFVHVGSEIGVLLLLFMLGLEYTGEQLGKNLRSGLPAGLVDFLLNFPIGLVAGLWMGWSPVAALLLGGVTYISSSGVIAKVLAELGRMGQPETPTILSVLVLEDLTMAVYLPLMAVLLAGQSWGFALAAVLIALVTVGVILYVAVRHGNTLSHLVAHQPDDVILFTSFGVVLLVAGVAQLLNVSAAIGAFLVGIAISGPVARQTRRLVSPLRDLFAATFFLFFGLQIDPQTLPPVLLPALGLGLLTALTKILTGWWAARHAGMDTPGRLRAGAALVARGEFSIIIAGLGVSAGLEPRLGPLSAAYVLFLAILGPILARAVDPVVRPFLGRKVA